MISSDYKHFEKEFRTSFKVFSFSLVDRGSAVKINERTKNATYSVKLDLGGANWLRESVHNILRINQVEDFRRFYRTHNYRLILECARNGAGRFLKLCKVQNGTLNYLFIPKESKWQGWRNLCCCLDSFFVNKYVQPKDRLGFSVRNQFQVSSKGVEKESYSEEWENLKAKSTAQMQEGIKSLKQEGMGNKHQRKDWRKAVVVYRNTKYLSWGEISKRIQTKFRRAVGLVSLAADRAILWCLDEEEVSSLISKPLQFSKGRHQVRIERWNMYAHWDNLQIHVHQSWIGIEGLPLNMWNIHVFKIIGKSLGGLLEVAPETKALTFLKYAKIRVGGLEGGFMDPILEILCQGVRVSLGLFAIEDPRNFSAGGRTLGLITRAIRAEQGNFGNEWREKQVRTGHVNTLQPAKPTFVLYRKERVDVMARGGKVNSVDSYKEALISAGSEKGGRKEVTGLKSDNSSFLGQGEVDGRYCKFAKEGAISAFEASENVRSVIQGQTGHKMASATLYSNVTVKGGVGKGIKKSAGVNGHNNPSLIEVGQAHKRAANNQVVLDSNQVVGTLTRGGYFVSPDQAHAQKKIWALSKTSSNMVGPPLFQEFVGLGPCNKRAGYLEKKDVFGDVFPGPFSELKIHNQVGNGYYSDLEFFDKKKKLVRRAVSVPIIQKPGSRLLSRINPKLKDSFISGKIIKWSDFSRQDLQNKLEKSKLSRNDSSKVVVKAWDKPPTLNVYSRNHSRKKEGGKTTKQQSHSGQQIGDALMGDTEVSEGEMGFNGLSSSDDDNSSEDFNITSDIDAEAGKEIQEDAAYEGVRCLLGNGRQEMEEVEGRGEGQLLNQSEYNGSLDYQNIGEGKGVLNALDIKLITVDKENRSDNRAKGTSLSKRNGVRELRNLVCNVNYEKSVSGKGKNHLQ